MARQKLNIPAGTACGKKRHYTVVAAERHRDQLAQFERPRCPSLPMLTVYHCLKCNAYHVGHSS
jgi:hypothetical protein